MTVLNVLDYGATGDGQTDDSGAIQQAIDDATAGDSVYLPEPDDSYCIAHQNKRNDNGPIITIDGDRHPDDLTIFGDGSQSVIKLADGHDSNFQMIRVRVGDGISGLRFRDLLLDGNKRNQLVDAGVGHGILIRDATAAARENVDIRHENIEVIETVGSALSTNNGGVVYERCTARNAERHGFSPDNDGSGVEDPPTEIRHCLAERCGLSGGYYGFDLSGGKAILTGSVAVGCSNGTKVTPQTNEAVYRRVRIEDTRSSGFMRPDTGGNCQITWEDVVITGSGNHSIRAKASDTHRIVDGSEIVCSDNGSNVNADLWFDNEPSLDAENADIYVTNSNSRTAFVWSSDESGILNNYYYSNNGGANIRNNGNLRIQRESDSEKTDIETVPTKDEVGAWTETDQTADEDDASNVSDEQFDNWTPQWESAPTDWGVVTGSEFDGGHALRFRRDGSDRSRYAISCDVVGTPADVELLDKFRVPQFTEDENLGFHARVHLRSSTEAGRENGYWIELEARENAFRLAKYTDGEVTILGRFGTPAEDTFFYRRFRAEGDELKAKVWPADEPEPTDWAIAVNDSDHTSGWVGLGAFDTKAVETDVFSVGTGGASASRTDPDDPPTLSWVEPTENETLRGTVPLKIAYSGPALEADSAAVSYRVDDDSWLETTYDADTELYEAHWDTNSFENDDYTLEARLDDSTDTVSTSTTVTVENVDDVETEDGPTIDRFDIENQSNSVWSRFKINWLVTDADGTLDTVVTELRFEDNTVTAKSTPVTGTEAEHTHVLRVRGDVDEVRLSVNDTENVTDSEQTAI